MSGSTRWRYHDADDGIVVQLLHDGVPLPPEGWALTAPEGGADGARGLHILLGLMEAERAEARDDGLLIPDAELARLEAAQLSALGLPPAAPFILRLESDGLLTDPSFALRSDLLWPDRRPVMGVERKGSRVKVGDRRMILLEPMYSLLEVVSTPVPGDRNERLLLWGRVKELLPEGAEIPQTLRSFDVARADAFTISTFLNDEGELDLEPVPALRKTVIRDQDSEDNAFVESPWRPLPPAELADYQRQFRRFHAPRPVATLSAGTLVVHTPDLLKALAQVREVQQAPESRRRAFAANPYASLREALPDLEEDRLEALFLENPGFGERVEGVTPWVARVIPFVKAAPSAWLPPEEIGILVGGTEIRLEPERLDALIGEIDQAIEAGEPFVIVDGTPVPATEETRQVIESLKAAAKAPSGGGARPEDATEEAERRKDGESDGDLYSLAIIDNIEDGRFHYAKRPRTGQRFIPRSISTTLLPHQTAALDWLQSHWLEGSPGALLADDMGLGKTLEALAFLSWVRESRGGDSPMLAVAPTGLLRNWEDEASKHLSEAALGAPLRAYGQQLRDLKRRGAGRRGELEVGESLLDLDALRTSGWVLTTYETLRDYQFSFARVAWTVVVFDECQKIKNPAAMVTNAAKGLGSKFTLMLTGTPVENHIADLWCIVDTCFPGFFANLEAFCRDYNTDDPAKLAEVQERLVTRTSDHPAVMLRRRKEDHIEGLPQKEERRIDATMPPQQALLYTDAVREAKIAMGRRGAMLEALHRLRSLSLSPPLPESMPSARNMRDVSARLSVLFDHLDRIHDLKEKALVFLESREIQPILAGAIQRRYELPANPLIINGAVAGDRRKARVDDFQGRRGFDVMILSPKAGGVGLTLTAANHVLHLSRWWNPAVEDQCSDRVFRIGQERPVTIYYLRAIHPEYGQASFDVRLDELLARKRRLFRELMVPPGEGGDDLGGLFGSTVGDDGDQANGETA